MVKSIAIIGAGTAGLSAALFLSRQGFEIDLFEEIAKPEAIGAGILLQPQGLFVLDKLGLLNNVIQQGAQIDSLVGCTNTGKEIMDFRYADLNSGLFGVGIHRGQLFSILYDAVLNSTINLHLGERVLSIKQQQHSAQLETSKQPTKDYQMVVIANGSWSQLSEQLDIKRSHRLYPWGALWKIFDDPEQIFSGALEQKYIGTHTMAGMLPTGINPRTKSPCVSFFWSLKGDDYKNWETTKFDQWQQQVISLWPELKPFITTPKSKNEFTYARYADTVMNKWHDRRVVVIGDAGHAMSPQLGQGANMALTDADKLAQCLQRIPDVATALDRYSKERKKHIQYYQFASRLLTPLFQSNSKLGGHARDFIFPKMKYLSIANKHALSTLFGVKPSLFRYKPNLDLEQLACSIKNHKCPIN